MKTRTFKTWGEYQNFLIRNKIEGYLSKFSDPEKYVLVYWEGKENEGRQVIQSYI